MIGEKTIEIAGKAYTIKADWRTGQLISERVADPFTIMMEFAKQQFMDEMGGGHAPTVDMGLVNSVKILHAALEAAGHNMAIDIVGNYFVGKQMPEAINGALEFVSLFGTDAGEMQGDEVESKPAGKSGGGSL